MMGVTSYLDCQEPVDKMYGVLALTDWGVETSLSGQQAIYPDYKRGCFDLGLDVSRLRLQASTSGDPKEFSQNPVANLALAENPPVRLMESRGQRQYLSTLR